MSDDLTITENVTLWDKEGAKAPTVSTDGAKERLDVSLGEENTFQLRAWVPVTTFDATGVSLNTSTWTTLLSIPADEGKLDFIACVGSSSAYRIRLTVDGAECYDISMADLASLGLSNAVNVPFWAETANKYFRYNPNTPVDFQNSLLIEAMAVTATPLLKYLITYREPA